MTGGATHVGLAHLFATGDVTKAVELTEANYRKVLEGQVILKEEMEGLEREIYVAKSAVRRYAENYKHADFNVLWPEVEFRVPLPGTVHHCWFSHRLLHPDDTQPFDPFNCPYPNQDCFHPHYFRGKTDAVIVWNRMIWLMEHKTSAQNQGFWWDQWLLDMQITGYIYGIWKATGTKPHGTLLNKINKPRKNAADPSNITFEREPYLRTEEDLLRFEKQITMIANDYETAFRTGNIYMNTSACLDYNRRCYFMSRCSRHNEDQPGEFSVREPDYVELAYYDILGLPKPKPSLTTLPKDSLPA
jgi:hypothetical protein